MRGTNDYHHGAFPQCCKNTLPFLYNDVTTTIMDIKTANAFDEGKQYDPNLRFESISKGSTSVVGYLKSVHFEKDDEVFGRSRQWFDRKKFIDDFTKAKKYTSYLGKADAHPFLNPSQILEIREEKYLDARKLMSDLEEIVDPATSVGLVVVTSMADYNRTHHSNCLNEGPVTLIYSELIQNFNILDRK